MTVEQRVRAFIIDELRWDGPRGALADDYELIERRVLDSMGIFRVVALLEEEYGIEVDDEDLLPEHFGTLKAIAGLVESKRGRRSAAPTA